MLVVLRVVAAQEGEGAPAQVAVQVADLLPFLPFAQDHQAFLQQTAAEIGGLSHEALDHCHVVLGQHGGHRIVLGGEFEQGEVVGFGGADGRVCAVGNVDSAVFVDVGVGVEAIVFEHHPLAEVQQGLSLRIGRGTIERDINNVQALGGEGDIPGIGGRAHGKHKAPLGHKAPDCPSHRSLQRRHGAEAELGGAGQIFGLLLAVPGGIAIILPELAPLTREILVVQMQPVVIPEAAGQHFFIIDGGIGHFGIGQGEGHGIIPGLLVGGRVDDNAGGLFKQHDVHVAPFDDGEYLGQGRRVHILRGDPPDLRLPGNVRSAVHEERAPPVVQQPLHMGILP